MSGTHEHRAARRPGRPVLTVVLAALVGLGVLAASVFLLTGGRFFTVKTPSMNGAAPVGSLVLTRPATVTDLHVGDVIAFRPPTEPDVTYTHRVVAVQGDTVRTRGDLNGTTDPWQLTDSDLVGRVASITPGLGWLVRALPLLIIGGLVVWGLTQWWVAPRNRGPARMAGAAFVFSVAALVLKPFVGVVQLANTSDPDGTSRISVVSTGLFPVRLTPQDGHGHAAPLDLPHAGHAGVSVLTGGRDGERYILQTHLHLSLLQWVLVIAICLLPVFWTLVFGYRPVPAPRHSAPARHSRGAAVTA